MKQETKNMTQEQHYYANPNEYTTEILDVFFYRADKDGNTLKDKNGKTICFVYKGEIEEMEGFDDFRRDVVEEVDDWDLLQCERQPDWEVEGSDVNQSKVMELPHVQEVLRLQEEEFEEELRLEKKEEFEQEQRREQRRNYLKRSKKTLDFEFKLV